MGYGEKRIPRFFIIAISTVVLLTFSFASLNLIGCGSDEAETVSQITELTDEEQKDLLRFVEYVLFPTTPYIDKSWVEVVPEEEVAEGEPIDFATETAAIQQTFTEFYNAYNAHDTRDVLATFWSQGIEFRVKSKKATGKATVRTAIESIFVEARRLGFESRWGPTPTLEEFYIRRAHVKGPHPNASAYGFNGPDGSLGTYLYLIKQGDRWLINQLATGSPPQKYFDDPKYKAPGTTIE